MSEQASRAQELVRHLNMLTCDKHDYRCECHREFNYYLAELKEVLAEAQSSPRAGSDAGAILKEVCEILDVTLGPGLARYAPLIAKVRALAATTPRAGSEALRTQLERQSVHMEAIARHLEGSGFSAINGMKVREWKAELDTALAAATAERTPDFVLPEQRSLTPEEQKSLGNFYKKVYKRTPPRLEVLREVLRVAEEKERWTGAEIRCWLRDEILEAELADCQPASAKPEAATIT